MHKLEKHIASSWSHLKISRISVACSGGLDSIVLAFILNKLGFKVEVIHVNYQLRSDDSEKDAAFVEQFCSENNIPFKIRIIDLNAELTEGGNLQELARNFRYDWFKEILEADANNRVALAHHLNDQVETFFLNIARKSGVMGLACMLSESNGVIRPLLDFTKEDLASYAKENNIEWREDISNADSKYKRNMLRNVILPELNESVPTLNESVITLVDQFQQKQKELEIEIQELHDQIVNNHALPLAAKEGLTEYALIELFRQLGETANTALAIQKLNQKGTKVELSGSFFREVIFDGDQFSFISERELVLPRLNIKRVSSLPKQFTKSEIYLDESKIKGELRLRNWQIGDRIASIGIDGTQLISDIISDAKLNSFEKAQVSVLCDDENIHWCVGLKVGRIAIANEFCEAVLKCQVQ